MMIVYYASLTDPDEPEEVFLGIFSSTEFAQKACQADHERRNRFVIDPDNPALEWVGQYGVLIAKKYDYEINPITVDEPIVHSV